MKSSIGLLIVSVPRVIFLGHHLNLPPAPNGKTLASAIIEHCLQPRCLLSPMDADFCSQIIKVIHTQGTPGFPTLLVYDKVDIPRRSSLLHIDASLVTCRSREGRGILVQRVRSPELWYVEITCFFTTPNLGLRSIPVGDIDGPLQMAPR